MNQPLPPILPGFPESEPFNELRFHLNELHWDLTSLVKDVEILGQKVPNAPHRFRHIRYKLESVTGKIEHDVSHHLALALKLAGQELEMPSLLKLGEQLASVAINPDDEQLPAEDVQADEPTKLYIALEELVEELRLALKQTDRVALTQAGEPLVLQQLESGLKHLAQILADRILSYVKPLYIRAIQLHRTTNPAEAAQEDYWQLLATPSREEYHPLARHLETCPWCGAMLTSDDRTFDGCYCESCRTLWIELPKPDEQRTTQ